MEIKLKARKTNDLDPETIHCLEELAKFEKDIIKIFPERKERIQKVFLALKLRKDYKNINPDILSID